MDRQSKTFSVAARRINSNISEILYRIFSDEETNAGYGSEACYLTHTAGTVNTQTHEGNVIHVVTTSPLQVTILFHTRVAAYFLLVMIREGHVRVHVSNTALESSSIQF
jgi:hypothetical protein